MWPLLSKLAGPVIETIGNWFGGKKDRESSEHQAQIQREFELGREARNAASQKEFAQHGIQWRVEDAKRAGLHPLFALAGGGAAFSPSGGSVPIQIDGMGDDIAKAGQSLGRAVTAAADTDARTEMEARLRLINAQADKADAEAALARSEAARRGQVGPPFPGVSSGEGAAPLGQVAAPPMVQLPPESDIPGQFDVSQAKASEVMSGRSDAPHVAAGPAAPASKAYRLTRGMQVLLPAANDLGEALEPLSESFLMLYAWYKINVREFGPKFADLAFQELGLPVSVLRGIARAEKAGEGLDVGALMRARPRLDVKQPSGGAAFGVYPHMKR